MRRNLTIRPHTLLLGAYVALGAMTAHAAIPATERDVLLALYTSTNGANWTDKTGWNGTSGTECGWFGITCDSSSTAIVNINLSSNNLTGTLPLSLNSLTRLQSVDFSQNRLTGSIPVLSGLTNLSTFNVSGNQLTGSIPSLTGLSGLAHFACSVNQLSGAIPPLASLPLLNTFIAAGNQLTGIIPLLTGLQNLRHFDVSRNQLTGSIPPLYTLETLWYFSVSQNQLSGSLPSLSGLSALAVFGASANQLSGSIPSLGNTPKLEGLFLSDNQLTGIIPSLTSLPELAAFNVERNQLTGSIPALTRLSHLQDFSVKDNQLSGSIPLLADLTSLEYLRVRNNRLTGTVPSLAGLSQLKLVELAYNRLTGKLPAVPTPNNSLLGFSSTLCPNYFDHTPDPAWDAATGITPWYSDCLATPVADFTWDPSSPNQNQAVQFFDISEGMPSSWLWNFGNGGTSTLQYPTYAYSTAGTYNVSLTATNAAGSNTKTKSITIGALSAPSISYFSANPSSLTAGQQTTLGWASTGGTSASIDNGIGAVTTTGTWVVAPAQTTAYTLTVSGFGGTATRQVTVTVSGACSLTCSASGPSAGAVGASLAFQASSTASNCANPVTYSWDFGDGSFSSQQNPVHAYAAAGTRNWSMTASTSGATCIRSGSVFVTASPGVSSVFLPSSSYRSGSNGAEYRTDVRILNQETSAVTVNASFYDQVTSVTFLASPFRIEARNQASFENVLQALFGRTLGNGAYGPIRFETMGPILVGASVNNVNACGSGAVSGQWLPGIPVAKALTTGVIGQLAVSANPSSGYRTNLVLVNPGNSTATATVTLRRGGGALLSTATIGPLSANGFQQVALDSLPGVAGVTDTNLWLEVTSDQPVLAYATIIHNVSGDPFAVVASAEAEASGFLPSSSFRSGTNAAEYRTDVRILNPSTAAVTVNASFYDQVTSTTLFSGPFRIEARNQASFDNILQSLFGKTLVDGAYGPIRFEATGPIRVGASVNNVNACASGAVSGQWLPGIPVSQALTSGVIGQLAVSSSPASGYRTNLVFVNPGSSMSTATVKIRRGGGALLSTATIGPLPANGFRQVGLDTLPGVAGTTDTNLWLEFTSDQPVLAYATIIHNMSGDPFAVVASAETPPDGLNGPSLTSPGGVPLQQREGPQGMPEMSSPTTEWSRSEREAPPEVAQTAGGCLENDTPPPADRREPDLRYSFPQSSSQQFDRPFEMLP